MRRWESKGGGGGGRGWQENDKINSKIEAVVFH